MDSIKIVTGMAVLTVASASAQIILKAMGKKEEALVLDFTSKCLLVGTAATSFVAVIEKINLFGGMV